MDIETITKTKKQYESYMKAGYALIILSFLLFIPVGLANGMVGAFVLQGTFLLGGIVVAVVSSRFKRLSIEFKNAYLPKMIAEIYPGSSYYPEQGFIQEDVFSTMLLQRADRYYSEDFISGNYQQIPFESADVKIQRVSHTGKSTTVTTVFLGRVYRFEFLRNFPTSLVLVQPGIGQKWGFDGLNHIETESIGFNSDFQVFARDEVGAFEILLPQFMEKLQDLDRKYGGKIKLSFLRNTLNVAINSSRDTFDLRMFKPVDDALFVRIRSELEDVRNIIDIFAKRQLS